MTSYTSIKKNKEIGEDVKTEDEMAMEKHIIMSHLKIPFSNDTPEQDPLNICSNHRDYLLHYQNSDDCCGVCGIQLPKRERSLSNNRPMDSKLDSSSASPHLSLISYR